MLRVFNSSSTSPKLVFITDLDLCVLIHELVGVKVQVFLSNYCVCNSRPADRVDLLVYAYKIIILASVDSLRHRIGILL